MMNKKIAFFIFNTLQEKMLLIYNKNTSIFPVNLQCLLYKLANFNYVYV